MEEFVTKFVNLQCYVPYLRNEKASVYSFMSCLPPTYKENIEFDMTKTMDEATRKAKLCYHLFKQRSEPSRNWQHKKNYKLDQRKKGFKPSPFRKGTRSHIDNYYIIPSSTNRNDVKSIENSSG